MLGIASSPFSPEATAILKEDFPDEWNDIKRYGYTNPEMIPYINEDPYIVVNLGLVSGVERFLVKTSKSAYIDIGVSLNFTKKIEIEVITNENYSGNLFGVRYQNNDTRVYISGTAVSFGANNIGVDANGILKFIVQIENNVSTWTVNGIQGTSQTASMPNINYNPYLFAINSLNSSVQESALNAFSSFKLKNRNINLWFVPFVDNNTIKVLDVNATISSGQKTIISFSGSGSTLSLEFSGRPYLNITSTTKTYIINTYGESAWNTVKEFFTDPATQSLVAAVNSDYTVVEELCGINGGGNRYLKSNNKAFILTNYIITEDDIIELECIHTDNTSAEYVFGTCGQSQGQSATFLNLTYTNYLHRHGIYMGGCRNSDAAYFTPNTNIKYTINYDKFIVETVNNVETYLLDSGTKDYISQPFKIFCNNRYGNEELFNTTYNYTGLIKSFKIKRNGVYTMCLIPRIVNNRAGFLDLVTNTMLYNNDSNVGSSLSVITI